MQQQDEHAILMVFVFGPSKNLEKRCCNISAATPGMLELKSPSHKLQQLSFVDKEAYPLTALAPDLGPQIQAVRNNQQTNYTAAMSAEMAELMSWGLAEI
eukprot:220679-Amphidinium_carterae.1